MPSPPSPREPKENVLRLRSSRVLRLGRTSAALLTSASATTHHRDHHHAHDHINDCDHKLQGGWQEGEGGILSNICGQCCRSKQRKMGKLNQNRTIGLVSPNAVRGELSCDVPHRRKQLYEMVNMKRSVSLSPGVLRRQGWPTPLKSPSKQSIRPAHYNERARGFIQRRKRRDHQARRSLQRESRQCRRRASRCHTQNTISHESRLGPRVHMHGRIEVCPARQRCIEVVKQLDQREAEAAVGCAVWATVSRAAPGKPLRSVVRHGEALLREESRANAKTRTRDLQTRSPLLCAHKARETQEAHWGTAPTMQPAL